MDHCCARCGYNNGWLELEFRAKLQGARIVGGGGLSEVRVRRVCINGTEFRVVEDIKVLETQFKFWPFTSCEWNGFEQGPVEIEESGEVNRIFSCIAKALIPAAIPGSDRHPGQQYRCRYM
jgi:hypothetical protein